MNYQCLQGPEAHKTLPTKERLILQTTVPHLDPTPINQGCQKFNDVPGRKRELYLG